MAKKRNRDPYIENVLTNRMKEKLLLAFAVMLFVMIALALYLAMINYQDGDKYSKYVLDNQQYDSVTLPFKRGDIKDKSGTVLAYSSKVYNLIFDPKVVLSREDYKEPTLTALTECFDLSWQDLESILNSKPSSQYERLLRGLTSEETAVFIEMMEAKNSKIKGVWFEEEYVRTYPFGSLACDVLGFATSASHGELGLENYYNDVLTGIDGVSYGYLNSDLNLEKTVKAAVDGYDIITTIDFSVQSIIEKHIKKFNEDYGSDNTAVIVMNPNNGEIIAEASYPVFDLNNPRDLTGIYTTEELTAMNDEETVNAMYKLWRNFCVSDIFEPGSTIKPFTVAAGLEEGILKGNEKYVCDGFEHILDRDVHCHNVNGHGELTLEGAVMQSCNDALMQISYLLGADITAKYQDIFGFGYKTYVDLPGEDAGITTEASKMNLSDYATNSFGQNFNVNMHQMVAGFASLINGGYYYQPHLVKRIETNNGEIVSTIGSILIRQTVTGETSKTLREYLYHTVSEGTAKKAAVEGYEIGGKTGTAEKFAYDENGENLGYRSVEDYLISFMGFAPIDDPQFVIYVVIDHPKVEAVGSATPACILAHDILADILPYLNVFPDYSENIVPNVPAVTEPETETTQDGTQGEPESTDGTTAAN
ncbi:MAG: penicillin-binding protein 2 [Alistipes sp.]|nr:penicillin-binding protein 2 [Alistipes sp.]